MTKKLTAMILALLIAFSAINIAVITVSAEGTDELISISTSDEATKDEATKDEATEDEAEILITGDINIDLEAINGRAIGLIGDVDLSGKVNIKDASNIQKYMAKLMTFSEKNKALADTDVSGKINIKDATAIQKYVAKIIDFDDVQLILADYDGNGKANVRDTTAIQKFLAGII